jgi:hypothetical protein
MVLVNIIQKKKINISDSGINKYWTENKFKYRWILYSKIFIFLTLLVLENIKLNFFMIMLNKYIKC